MPRLGNSRARPAAHWQRFDPLRPPPDGDYLVWIKESDFYEAGAEMGKLVGGHWQGESDRFWTTEPNEKAHNYVSDYAKVLEP